jgi:hypothetical protein
MFTAFVVSLPAAVFTGANLWMGRPFIKVLSCRAEFNVYLLTGGKIGRWRRPQFYSIG